LKNRLPFVPERPAAVKDGRLFPAGRELLRADAGFDFFAHANVDLPVR
jgi:hypothetical protein